MTERPLRVLLLENIHASAREAFRNAGFEVESLDGSPAQDELVRLVRGFDVVGIRSKTHLTRAVLEAADELLAVGCFCIGTNQVDLVAANARGVPVFNAPFSNTRSVAELVIAEIVALSRQLGDRSREVHAGTWRKVATGCHEIRGKTLGIVGYGHIGSQVGVLAEAMGMRVVYYDVASKLALGNVRPMPTLAALLAESDFVTLHVPATPQTNELIGSAELALMKPKSYLINASRGSVVVIESLAEALGAGHLAGAAIDVYPEEPEANGQGFVSPLQGLANVILTPHIGGSTVEAQAAIGKEVATTLLRFVELGATTRAVNFPEAELPLGRGVHRVLNVHRNVPGVLRDVNRIVSDRSANIVSQVLATDATIGYLVMDLQQDVADDVHADIARLPTSIRTRILRG